MHYVRAAIFSAVFLCIVGTVSRADDASVLDAVQVDFELLNRDGERVRAEDFRGKNVLLAFGFTHCAHICPMIAANMASALRSAEQDAVGIFVSVDTERDTPAITDNYARKFGADMLGLSGTYEQVSIAAKNFNVTFVVTKSEDNYTVQHTPSIFLIGPQGDLLDVFALNTAPGKIVSAMQ